MIYCESPFSSRYWCKPNYLEILGPTVPHGCGKNSNKRHLMMLIIQTMLFPIPSILRRSQKKIRSGKMSMVSVVLLPHSWQVSDKPDFPEQSIIKHHRPTPNTTHLKIHSKTENDPPAHRMTKPNQIRYQAGRTPTKKEKENGHCCYLQENLTTQNK